MENIRITDLHHPVQSRAMIDQLKRMDGVNVKLDAQSLVDLAIQKLDIPIDIDEGLPRRFEELFAEIVERAPTHVVGRYSLQQIAVNGMIQTSYMNHILRNQTEAAVPIGRPLIVAGLPRSGTTHLLQLLTTEQEFIWLKTWEAMMPFPSPAMLSGDVPDDREEQCVAAHDQFAKTLPLKSSIYDAGVQDSTEEIELMIHACYGLVPGMLGDAPAFDAAYYGKDRTVDYEYLYRQLQALQWVKKARKDQRWLLKSPAHLGVLPSLNSVFPDASLVFTHRDPASVFASLINLLGYSTRAYYSSISKDQLIGKAKRMLHGFLRGVVDNAGLFEDRCIHMYFHDLKRDVIEYVERIYSLSGMHYDAAARQRVAQKAGILPRGHSGKRIVYDIETDFGINRDQIRNEFSYYIDKYPVQIEEEHE